MKTIITLYFTYKPSSGFDIDEYIPFTTVVLDQADKDEYEYSQKWLSNILDARLKADPDIASFVIIETEEEDEGSLIDTSKQIKSKVTRKKPKGNVVSLDFTKKDD